MSSIQNTSVNRKYVINNKRYIDMEKQFHELFSHEINRIVKSDLYDEEFFEKFDRKAREFSRYRVKLFYLRGSTLPAFILQNYRNKIFKTQRRIIKELEVLIQNYY